jgi:hypothetical protein
MQYSTKRHTAIFSEGSKRLHCNLISVAPSKKIAVLCFHTAEVFILETKMEFKRVRNHESKQTQAMFDNLTTWSIIHFGVSYAQMPTLY